MLYGLSAAAAIHGMDWSAIEKRIKAHYANQEMLLCIPTREVSEAWLQRYLCFKEMYGHITVMVADEHPLPQGKRATWAVFDDLIDSSAGLAVIGASFSMDYANGQDFTDIMVKTLQTRDEPITPVYQKRQQAIPESKGERKKNRRYRWC